MRNPIVIRFGVLLVLGVGLFVALKVGMRNAQLSPGDKLETRQCRDCGGSGKEGGGDVPPGMAQEGPPPGMPGAPGGPCVACNGAGKVEVIIPGPNHPTWVRLTVRDRTKVPAEGDYEASAMVAFEERDPRRPVVGAIADAKIVAECNGQTVEIHSNATGRGKLLLTPGTWKLKTSAEGFADLNSEFVVPVLTHPIYLEKARIVREPDSFAQEQAEHGLGEALLLTPR